MTDVIVILILAVIVLLAAGYIYKAKKSGKTCIGCPHSGTCGSCSCCGVTVSDAESDDDAEPS